MTWDEARSSCMNDGGDLMGHETPRELSAISYWIAPGLYLFRGDIKEALKLWNFGEQLSLVNCQYDETANDKI